MYKIVIEKKAFKFFQKLSPKEYKSVRRSLDLLAENPKRKDLDIKKLKGRDGYRLRIGKWRILYDINQKQITIYVLDAGARGDIYK